MHGNPATAERNCHIRGWLPSNCYEAIETSAHELADDRQALQRSRGVATFLGIRNLRHRLRADRLRFREPELID